MDNVATVQPGEPPDTGVRTKWWVWTAPADGRYTWRLADPSHAELRVAAFSGETLDALRLLGSTGGNVPSFEFSFAAARDESYRISVGLPGDDIGAFYREYHGEALEWGPTPANDETTGAPPLAGASGSVAGSNAFATVEPGERVSGLGHSSLWWDYEAPADGWYRFRLDGRDLPFALAVYEVAADGSLKLIGVSHRPGAPAATTEVVFRAVTGGRYRVRLGSLGDAPGGDFTMRWEETAAPAWLRYVGRLADGGTDGAGGPVHLGRVSGLAFSGDGAVLFAASATGLHALERDPATGALTVAYTLGAALDGMSLVWDLRRGRLRAYDCFRQRTFLADGGAPVPEGDAGGGAGNGIVCRGFMDAGGDSLYVVNGWGTLEVYGVDADGRLRHVETVAVPGIRNAAVSRDDAHVYRADRPRPGGVRAPGGHGHAPRGRHARPGTRRALSRRNRDRRGRPPPLRHRVVLPRERRRRRHRQPRGTAAARHPAPRWGALPSRHVAALRPRGGPQRLGGHRSVL